MEQHEITMELTRAFETHLRTAERGEGTIEKYLRDLGRFAAWSGGRADKETAIAWKASLQERGYAGTSINAMLAAVKAFFRFAGWEECRVRALRLQRRMFREPEKELSKEEYVRLLETARRSGRERLALLMETTCATGIRVSEVRYITVEAVAAGRAEIALKGKLRTILLPGKLCRKLCKYAAARGVTTGEVFRTRTGNSLSRKQIWAEMKTLCEAAGVPSSRVFPHNLRHLFARAFYLVSRDVAQLADVLGHSSVETTRIYLLSTGAEHLRQLERLELIC
ncbi:MAG: tyrosine-type recombinase/integrase [Clostridia bacterium]|nr:tyrosine-type recombinase/integrase [Clostridia bacterium]